MHAGVGAWLGANAAGAHAPAEPTLWGAGADWYPSAGVAGVKIDGNVGWQTPQWPGGEGVLDSRIPYLILLDTPKMRVGNKSGRAVSALGGYHITGSQCDGRRLAISLQPDHGKQPPGVHVCRTAGRSAVCLPRLAGAQTRTYMQLFLPMPTPAR